MHARMSFETTPLGLINFFYSFSEYGIFYIFYIKKLFAVSIFSNSKLSSITVNIFLVRVTPSHSTAILGNFNIF